MRRLSKGLSFLALVFCLLLFMGNSSMGATFTVTNTNDIGPGSLRDAINAANSNMGNDIIDFSISPGGLVVITPLSQLPPLVDPSGVLIDGLTQPGGATCGLNPPSTANLLVELRGTSAGGAHGLWVTSSNNIIQGLIINQFEQDGIRIEGGVFEPMADNNFIRCNFIGTDYSGTLDWGNGTNLAALWAGVSIHNINDGMAMNNTIEGNLISGNYAEGVNIVGPIVPGDVGFNHVISNYIGTDITGTVDLGNDHEGVCLSEGAHDNDVVDNLISGNDYDGVGMQGFDNVEFPAPPIYTYNNIIVNNIIGLDVFLAPLGNSMHGIAVGEYGQSQWGFAYYNTIDHNTIAYNGGDGVAVWEHGLNPNNADYNIITQNNIYDNNGLGIDLQNDGVTVNDVNDPDTGPNQELNFPIILSAVYSAGVTTVSGNIDIDSDPTQAIVEVFFVNIADPTGYGEGDLYLGSANPDIAGNWTYVDNNLNIGDILSATTTDLTLNTSEFCEVYVVTGQSQTGACCYPDGTCSDETSQNCTNLGGTFQGIGTACLGDNNGNGIDDACEVIDTVVCEPQGGNNPTHPPTYWYDVTPGDGTGRCDFHVLVHDSISANYSNWIEPTGWIHSVHKVANDWWVSYWDPTGCTNAIFTTFRFQFDNHSPSVWEDWTTTISGTNDPNNQMVDASYNHPTDPDGYGFRVHVPFLEEEPPPDTCDYYKSPYDDYAPNGMPDFDQKQSNWIDQSTGSYSHCGPVALANCFWWFDSKFETNTTPPPAVIDNYPLVTAFGGPPWDDHDANNVIPFVDSLALYCNTNAGGQSGTFVFDLAIGAQNWLASVGLLNDYTVNLWPVDGITFDLDSIKAEVLRSQDVILLLGFWEEYPPGADYCERIGGHYVTVAGTCVDPLDSALCISDPFLDMHEGEPPAGSAHASNVHNDAYYISGPHGTIYHDKYYVQPVTCVPISGPMFVVELANYPVDPAIAGAFFGQNSFDPAIPPVPPQGGIIHTVIEWAVVICPVVDTCANQMPGDANTDGTIDTLDIVYLINFLYSGGPAPNPLANGDPNGDCEINVGDIVYLTNFLYSGGPAPVLCTCVNPDVGQTACCFYYRGNIDYDPTDGVDIADLVYFVEYSFNGGPAPPCIDEADVDASGGLLPLDIADIVYLVAYMFSGGPAPLICP